jgi:hypothetical protein
MFTEPEVLPWQIRGVESHTGARVGARTLRCPSEAVGRGCLLNSTQQLSQDADGGGICQEMNRGFQTHQTAMTVNKRWPRRWSVIAAEKVFFDAVENDL